jgi:hypothetical protein
LRFRCFGGCTNDIRQSTGDSTLHGSKAHRTTPQHTTAQPTEAKEGHESREARGTHLTRRSGG